MTDCIKECKIIKGTVICTGCGRTIEEITEAGRKMMRERSAAKFSESLKYLSQN